jgi:phosphoribosylanthranilate isomerase
MTWVKICGITNEDDALHAIAMGADALGFIFAQGSKRQVQVAQVADIVRRLPPEVLTIGVFRNDLPERVVQVVERCGLAGAQLHGLENTEQTAEVSRRVQFVIKAFAFDDPTLAKARRYTVSSLLIDGPEPGSGETFDWNQVGVIPRGMRWILAGGLNSGNVGRAVAAMNPWGVDVASGVESSPGVKDARLVREFIKAAKAAKGERAESFDQDSPSEQGDFPDEWDRPTDRPFDFEVDA